MNDWIEWKGGECPVPPETIVRIQIRAETRAEADGDATWDAPAGSSNWQHHDHGSDIIAYRIVEDQS